MGLSAKKLLLFNINVYRDNFIDKVPQALLKIDNQSKQTVPEKTVINSVVPKHIANKIPLSAFLVCKNEESHIESCLKSLSFCDEIVVVDSFSTDRTPEICKSYGVTFYQRDWPGYRAQKEYACSLATNDWVFLVDSDEVVSDGLRQEILSLLENRHNLKISNYNGFFVGRVMFHMDKWWKKGGWYPEKKLRLFKKNSVTWGGIDPHEKVIIDGQVGNLAGELEHFSYDSLNDQVKKLLSHSSLRAKEEYNLGRRVNLFDIVIRPILRFVKFYILKKGFLEGTPGLVMGILEAYYTFLKYAQLLEIERKNKTENKIEDKKEDQKI